MNYKYLLLFVSFFFVKDLICQNSFYSVDTVRDVRLYFYDYDWDNTLDSLYVLGQNDRILADLEIDGNIYDSVGVRYKGFSSASVNYKKNPFNIKIDYIINGQNHEGFDKLKLANVIQDPSFVREVLSYDIARKYMPAPEANYVNLYVNDTLIGLYVNVEAINKDFLLKHFDHKSGPFFKCNPENLDIQIGAENSNLSNTHGNDSSYYYNYYDLKSNYGWSDLYNLIDTLNNYPDSIESLINLDRVLWMHAFNYSLINFDSYIGYSQNYYLYKDQTKRFNPLVWDLNMSFGGFRLTDASQLYFSGFSILQAQNMDPLTHYNYISVSPRPLMSILFDNERYRKMYIAHIRTIMHENFVNNDYLNQAQYFQSLIDVHVQNDTNKFYSYADFLNNINSSVNLVASICPGITDLMDARSLFLSNYTGYSGEPIITNISNSPQNIFAGSDVWINADVNDANYVMLAYRFGKNHAFKKVQMYDDGNHNDGVAGDNNYGVKINNSSNSIDYYIYADNDSAGVFSPQRAAYEYYSIFSDLNTTGLVINELMSNNENFVSDFSGDYDDWIELHNNNPYPVSTKNIYISDTLSDILKWELPDYSIPPFGYFILWADDEQSQGFNHANFKLSNYGETILLSTLDSLVIDSVTYLGQSTDLSYARNPNGVGPFVVQNPTFNKNNNLLDLQENHKSLTVFPNPFIDFMNVNSDSYFIITDILGRIMYSFNGISFINTSSWKPGLYFVNSGRESFKVIKQ